MKILEMKRITKRFSGGILANDNIDFDIYTGEIHALLGENGAGKTTLMNTLSGLYQPDEGEIFVRGKKVNIRSPQDAHALGIGMVHQHRKLIPAHTVIENIMLGHPNTEIILNPKRVRGEIGALADRFGLDVDLDARVWQLDAGEAQMVEIIKALYFGARILILDEPTSSLSPPETEKLLAALKDMVDEGLAVIPFVTHKLPIVLQISNRITILRNGRVVSHIERKDATEITLAKMMVGKEKLFELARVDITPGDIMLKIEKLSTLNDKGYQAVTDLSLTVREGEIFAIAGIAGNGQHELAEAIMGLRKCRKGKIIFDRKDITQVSIRKRWQMGIAYVPANRTEVASIGDFTLADNMAIHFCTQTDYSSWGFLKQERICKDAETAVCEFGIKAPNLRTRAKQLSGGNLQKLILARVMSCRPRLLVANLPTQGLDVGAAEFVQNKLLELKKARAAIVLISEDLDEILSLGDKIAPIYEGKLMAILSREEANKEKIGQLMAGL